MTGNTFVMRNFDLQCGITLPEVRLVYRTYGTLNGPKSNAILFPTWFCAHHHQLEWLIGAGRALDPTRYFIATVNLLGNGLSSSPSNTPKPFDRGRFPAVSHVDNVRLQLELLQREWQIERLALVVGRSMGAQVAFQWGCYFPDRVQRLLALAGTARTTPHNYIFLETVKQAILSDPAFESGEYRVQPLGGLRQMRLIYDSWVLSQAYYRQGLHLRGRYNTTQEYLARPLEGDPRDANDVLAQIGTWQKADISANQRFQGDFVSALKATSARAIVMPSLTDLYFPPDDSAIEVSHMPNAKLRIIPSVWGHRAGAPGGDPADIAFIDAGIKDLLEDAN